MPPRLPITPQSTCDDLIQGLLEFDQHLAAYSLSLYKAQVPMRAEEGRCVLPVFQLGAYEAHRLNMQQRAPGYVPMNHTMLEIAREGIVMCLPAILAQAAI
ncbi:hypothetical protein ABBQ38_013236 [Trebouxia sp. C0009 RCD-2024]